MNTLRRSTSTRLRHLTLGAVATLAATASLLSTSAMAGADTFATVNGQGSTYAALAFQTWTQATQVAGLNVNYTATGSPAGLQSYAQNTADFAGTEAEYSELYSVTQNGGTPNSHVARGFGYTPDVAGAIAIMYHVHTPGGTTVNYLHLSRLTVAKIFLGVIRNWNSPTISEDNKGLVLPNQQITIDCRSGQSGTTALFYDFVKQTDPADFQAWATHNGFPLKSRVWEVDNGSGGFGSSAAGFNCFSGSDLQAQAVASNTGLWSIGYDEFGYAKVYHDNVAWIGNAAGQWVQPYALNIAAALKSAVLASDTSQTLDAVYSSTTPTAYPISAYSYILYQCASTPTRPTCKGPYPNQGITNTMAKFMRYIACTGQVKMATIGYSPLPTQLSQFLANAIGYMTGQPAEALSQGNCANPQFKGGSLGVGSHPPPDPTATKASLGSGPGGSSSSTTTTTPGSTATGPGGTTGGGPSTGSHSGGTGGGNSHSTDGNSTGTVAGGGTTAVTSTGLKTDEVKAVGGGSGSSQPPAPVAYVGPDTGALPPGALVALFLLLLVPVVLLSVRLGRRRPSAGPVPGAAPPDGGTTDDLGKRQ